ncbi:ATP-dependent nuclease [Demequina sp. SO4-13]|uniref:ATP-dependent nuclease n=1 Tax=Demequina sp. SO4-13 TaxID=3401027 RepID=UPI003AF837C8
MVGVFQQVMVQHEGKAMRLDKLTVENFKSLRAVDLPLSKFGCVVGENNAGKSALLHAVQVFFQTGPRRQVSRHDFYDLSEPIRIALAISNIDEQDLARIENEGHRTRLEQAVKDGTLTLVRVFEPGSTKKEQLKVVQRQPRDTRLSVSALADVGKGLRGADKRKALVEAVDGLDPFLGEKPTNDEVGRALEQLLATLGPDEFENQDVALGSGIDNSIDGFLPEPLYVEAVRDVRDDLKTTDTATLGKMLGLLLEEITQELDGYASSFDALRKKLSRVAGPDGTVVDERLGAVKAVEDLVQGFVRENFPDVSMQLDVPVPEVRTVLGGSRFVVDDGVQGPLEGKGDGLKRMVIFSLIRAYSALLNDGLGSPSPGKASTTYWLLFEEPELYLHPWAQRQLVAALAQFSSQHLVLMTTHTPAFLDTRSLAVFSKISKRQVLEEGPPESVLTPVDLQHLPLRKNFQMINTDHNGIGFFARKVLLVEGDSDAVCIEHLAHILDPEWDFDAAKIAIARVGGKSNFEGYRQFFTAFKTDVEICCDLDALLKDFDKLGASEQADELRVKMIDRLNEVASETSEPAPKTGPNAGDLAKSGNARAQWESIVEQFAGDSAVQNYDALKVALADFFRFTRRDERLGVLAEAGDAQLRDRRDALLRQLREEGIYVLSRGAIESYIGEDDRTSEKVRAAVDWRDNTPDWDTASESLGEHSSTVSTELREIFGRLFIRS